MMTSSCHVIMTGVEAKATHGDLRYPQYVHVPLVVLPPPPPRHPLVSPTLTNGVPLHGGGQGLAATHARTRVRISRTCGRRERCAEGGFLNFLSTGRGWNGRGRGGGARFSENEGEFCGPVESTLYITGVDCTEV